MLCVCECACVYDEYVRVCMRVCTGCACAVCMCVYVYVCVRVNVCIYVSLSLRACVSSVQCQKGVPEVGI